MADSEIPKAVTAFITDHIDSLYLLEILLLLYRNPAKEYAAEDVARELGIEPSAAAPRLADLRAKGLLVSASKTDSFYRYEPNTDALGETVDQVVRMYGSHRVSITNLIFAKPSGALRSFADAFRIRKDRVDG